MEGLPKGAVYVVILRVTPTGDGKAGDQGKRPEKGEEGFRSSYWTV